MKPVPQIVQILTVGSVALALGLLASPSPAAAQMAPTRVTPPVQERRPAPQGAPNSQYSPYQRGTETEAQQGGTFVDAHVDAHMNKAERPDPYAAPQEREERWHPWTSETRQNPRWTPSAERYTRPPQQWNR